MYGKSSGEASPTFGPYKCKFSCVYSHYRPYKESISKEMNNDNDLNLNLHDQNVGLASLLGKTHKKFERCQHSEIYLLTLKEQDKTKMELPIGIVS